MFLAQGKSGKFAIGFSSRATLYEIAEALTCPSVAKTIEFSEVLILDGSVSGGFWYGNGGVSVNEPVQVPVKTLLVLHQFILIAFPRAP